MPRYSSFKEVFHDLKNISIYRKLTKQRVGKIILGSSVIRVFVKGTRDALLSCLDKIPAENVIYLQTQKEYDQWHYRQVKKVYTCLRQQRGNVSRIGNNAGLEYGHSTKIVNLFMGHLVFYSPYFKKKDIKTISSFLHVPLDKKVFDALRACNMQAVPRSIKKVDKKTYYKIQGEIRESAKNYNLPPLYFDEYAWTFEKEE